jgi:phytoene dehydrogenase-like protein
VSHAPRDGAGEAGGRVDEILLRGGLALSPLGFDVIVVGGGWGGLGTAALLSRRGAHVLLLEARGSLGGRASYEERDGFLVDFGVHAHRFGRDGAAAALYRELGESLDLVEPGDGVVEYRGKEYPVPLRARQFAASKILDRRSEARLIRALKPLILSKPDSMYGVSIKEAVPSGTDKDTSDFVSALAGLGLISKDISMTSAGELAWFLHRAVRSVNHLIAFPRRGCHQHVQRLSAAVRDRGEVRTGLKARSVVLEKGRAAGVETDEGRMLANAVVLAVPAPRVPGLLPEGCVPERMVAKLSGIVPSAGLSWDIGLRRAVTDAHMVFVVDPLIIGAFPSNYDHLLCPPGMQLSTWCMPLSLRTFAEPDAVRREIAVLRRKVFHMFKQLEDNILWERMLKLPVIDGAVPLVSQSWPRRPGPELDAVEGLFLGGDTVGVPGEGGDIAFRSAIECAAMVGSYLS